ncbi:MAG: hypothetical protein GF330_03860 [Candidatus Eisenbacteria bacterium]|nr:hypothetical protein [Candidatus Eisenbacteria bacterium]
MKRILWPILAMAFVALAPSSGAQESDASTAVARESALLRGTITDASGTGLSGVTVKIFEEGFLVAESQSGAGGTYQVEFEYAPELDWTMVVWFVPQREDLIPEIAMLRESFRSKEMELWSSCLPRLELRPVIKYDAQLYDEAGKLAQMSELDCLED